MEAKPDTTSEVAPELEEDDDAADAVELPEEPLPVDLADELPLEEPLWLLLMLAPDAVETATAIASTDPEVVKVSVVVAYESFSA